MSVSIIEVIPEYTKNKQNYIIESCENESVSRAINQIINIVKNRFGLNVIRAQNALINLLNNIPDIVSIDKANSICPYAIPTNSPLYWFMANVKNDYENILENEYINFSYDIHNEITRLTTIKIMRECLTDIHNSKFQEPNTWFGKRISLYNPVVNFEHVCLLVHAMLVNNARPSIDVIYPFYYFVNLWVNHRDNMKWLIYHYIKLIRVYVINKYSTSSFSPVRNFTNMRFGTITDQNIEVYGDVKLNSDRKNIFSLFSLFPRSHVVKTLYLEKSLFFSWNTITSTPLMISFSIARDNLINVVNNPTDLTDYDLLMSFIEYDISPRLQLIDKQQKINYETVYIQDIFERTTDNEKFVRNRAREIPDALYIELVNYIGNHYNNINQWENSDEYNNYKNHIVYVTYTGCDGVKTVSTHRSLSKLFEAVKIRTNSDGVFISADNIIKIERKQYIPLVCGNFSAAKRNIITPADKTWEEIYEKINNVILLQNRYFMIANDQPQPYEISNHKYIYNSYRDNVNSPFGKINKLNK